MTRITRESKDSPETRGTRVPRNQSRAGAAVSGAESFPQFAIVPGNSRVAADAARETQVTRLLRCCQLLWLRTAVVSITDVQLLLIGCEMRLLQRLAATVGQVLG